MYIHLFLCVSSVQILLLILWHILTLFSSLVHQWIQEALTSSYKCLLSVNDQLHCLHNAHKKLDTSPAKRKNKYYITNSFWGRNESKSAQVACRNWNVTFMHVHVWIIYTLKPSSGGREQLVTNLSSCLFWLLVKSSTTFQKRRITGWSIV